MSFNDNVEQLAQ